MFTCSHCHKEVTDSPIGTKQRNHCPFCLWSLHLDDKLPGDRKSLCHGLMQPIGLTTKSNPITKLARHPTSVVARHLRNNEIGELMVLHQCEKCRKYSKNRLAGDDDSKPVEALLEAPTINANNEPPWPTLTIKDKEEVRHQLYGN